MSDQNARMHEILSNVKNLAVELGKTPTIDEIRNAGISTRHEVVKLFGGFTPLLHSIGLKPATTRKIDSTVFIKNLERHLDAHDNTEHKPLPEPKHVPHARIMSISDIHWPFANKRVLAKFFERVSFFKPEYIFLNGDAWDMYSHTKFPRSHNVFTPKEERALSRKMNVEFWEEVLKRAPKAKCYQMLGNHDIRPLKRALESYPESEEWVMEGLKKDFTFEGVETIFDPRQEVIIGDIAIFHGYRSKLGEHRDYTFYNCINGHTHKGGTVFRRIRDHILWEANSGLAGDPTAKGLTYTPQKITEWTGGFLEVDEFGPRFFPVT